MANAYNSCYTGAHNDEYNSRIAGLEGKATTFTAQITTLNNKATTFTAQITTLQSSTTALSTTMSTKVAKAGDTMTGNLSIKDTRITATITSNFAGRAVVMTNNDGTTVGRYDTYWTTANHCVRLYSQDVNSSSTPIYNILQIGFNNDKTRYVSVSEVAPWKKALSIGSAYGNQKWTTTTMNGSTTSTSKTISITTVGRPVFLCMSGDINPTTNQTCWGTVRIFRGSTELCRQIVESRLSSQNNPYCLTYLDAPSAGTYTYKGQFDRGAGIFTMGEDGNVNAPQFSAFEI